MQRSVRLSGTLVTALMAGLALSGEARGDDVLRAGDVGAWSDDACPLAGALGPMLDAEGDIAVDATKKKLTIRVGAGDDAPSRSFSVRKGDDLEAMRDTVLGTCSIAPGIAGVTNVRFDLRDVFRDAADTGRAGAVARAVESLRKQRGQMRSVATDLTAACEVALPTLPAAPARTAEIPAIQSYLQGMDEATATLERAGDACRGLERVHGLAPAFVRTSPERMRSVRERVVVAVKGRAEARTTWAPQLGHLLVSSGYIASKDVDSPSPKVMPWSALRGATQEHISTALAACATSADACVVPLSMDVCPAVTKEFMKDDATRTPRRLVTGFYPYVGGTAWCETEEGKPICSKVRADESKETEEAVKAGCTDAFLKGNGPANLARAKQLKAAADAAKAEELREAWNNLTRLGTMFSGAVSSSTSSGKQCKTVELCTCTTNGQQMKMPNGCPRSSDYGCHDGYWERTDLIKECQ